MQLFKKIWTIWKSTAYKLGLFQTRVTLTIFYFILLLPIGIVFTFMKDGLGIKDQKKTRWIRKTNQSVSLQDLKKQS